MNRQREVIISGAERRLLSTHPEQLSEHMMDPPMNDDDHYEELSVDRQADIVAACQINLALWAVIGWTLWRIFG